MSMSSIPSHSPSGKLYGWVERIGNKVPHPFLLYLVDRGFDGGDSGAVRL